MAYERVSVNSVADSIREKGLSWQSGQTSVSELGVDEQLSRLGYVPGLAEPSLADRERLSIANRSRHRAIGTDRATRPAVYDLRNVEGQSFITPIRDQGNCGSCVAFGTCAAIEGSIRVAEHNPSLPIDLSEAHLFYCIARAQGRRCNNGWSISPALDAFRTTGVADEECYPYRPGDQDCTGLCTDWTQRVTKIADWISLTSVDAMKEWIVAKGPLVSVLSVYADFYSYVGGVYEHVEGGLAGLHCISVIGYDDSAEAWICKNSWGPNWGEQGFFRIAYGQCGLDATMWGIDVDGQTTTIPLYRYWNSQVGDHFYTTSWSELGTGKYGWKYEGIQCYVSISVTRAPSEQLGMEEPVPGTFQSSTQETAPVPTMVDEMGVTGFGENLGSFIRDDEKKPALGSSFAMAVSEPPEVPDSFTIMGAKSGDSFTISNGDTALEVRFTIRRR